MMSDVSLKNADAKTVREVVAGKYARYAAGTSGVCPAHAEKIGYSADDLAAIPAGADISTMGCGNPLSFLEVAEGDTVVDLGSGAGFDLLIAAEKVGPTGHVIGVDMTDEMIEKARHNVASAGHQQVEVRKGLIEDLPVETGTVDWVISNCVINLSPEKERVFAEIARVLKPGGQMLVSDLVVKDLPHWLRDNVIALGACVGGAISEEEYLAGLRRAGLTDVAVRTRHAYTAAELSGWVESAEEAGESCGSGGCGCGDGLQSVLEDLGGKVVSIKVHARK